MTTQRSTTHRELVAQLVSDGWRTEHWRGAVIRLVNRPPWDTGHEGNDVFDILDDVPIVPDAWRVDTRLVPEPRLLLRFAEVEIRSLVTPAKLYWLDLLATSFATTRNMRFECHGISHRGAWAPIISSDSVELEEARA